MVTINLLSKPTFSTFEMQAAQRAISRTRETLLLDSADAECTLPQSLSRPPTDAERMIHRIPHIFLEQRVVHMSKPGCRYYRSVRPKNECHNSNHDSDNEKVAVQTEYLAGKAMKVQLSIAAFRGKRTIFPRSIGF